MPDLTPLFLTQLKQTVGSTYFCLLDNKEKGGYCIVTRDLFDDTAGSVIERLTFTTALAYKLAPGDLICIEGYGNHTLGNNTATDLVSYQAIIEPYERLN